MHIDAWLVTWQIDRVVYVILWYVEKEPYFLAEIGPLSLEMWADGQLHLKMSEWPFNSVKSNEY